MRLNKINLFFIFLLLTLAGCAKYSKIEQVQGTVSVQIPIQENAETYRLRKIDLYGIQNLKEVSGDFVRFFYSPGSNQHQLTGQSPRAHFISAGSFFIPADYISVQMATIYYHLQNLALFDSKIGAAGINQWPRSIGLETRVAGDEQTVQNNAFYDGATDAMMFVPYVNKDLPISINAGILAHEHFHSLFYKIVLKPVIASKKVLFEQASIHSINSFPLTGAEIIELNNSGSKKNKDVIKLQKQPEVSDEVLFFNEAYVRGLNEGLADFWGWIYTEDADFMKWSLPGHVTQRSLTLSKYETVQYQTNKIIEDRLANFMHNALDVRDAIKNYSYTIGTPHARFLRTLTQLQSAENKDSLAEAKNQMAQDIIQYLKKINVDMISLRENEKIPAIHLFKYFAEKKLKANILTDQSCQFLISYLNFKAQENEMLECRSENDKIIFAVKR